MEGAARAEVSAYQIALQAVRMGAQNDDHAAWAKARRGQLGERTRPSRAEPLSDARRQQAAERRPGTAAEEFEAAGMGQVAGRRFGARPPAGCRTAAWIG